MVVGDDVSNEFLERIQVVPHTGSTEKIYPSEVTVTLRGKKSKAVADQIATVSKLRVSKKSGMLADQELEGVE